jgi:hypothetical protein
MNNNSRRTNRFGNYSFSNKSTKDLINSINGLILKLDSLEPTKITSESVQAKTQTVVEDPNQLVNHRVHFSKWGLEGVKSSHHNL